MAVIIWTGKKPSVVSLIAKRRQETTRRAEVASVSSQDHGKSQFLYKSPPKLVHCQ